MTTTVKNLIDELSHYDENTPIVIPTYRDHRDRYAFGYSNAPLSIFEFKNDLINADEEKVPALCLNLDIAEWSIENNIQGQTVRENFEAYQLGDADDLLYLERGMSLPYFKPMYYEITDPSGNKYIGKTTKTSSKVEEKAGFKFVTIIANGGTVTGVATVLNNVTDEDDKNSYVIV